MTAKKIFLTEEQFELIKGNYPVDPKKVLYIKKYLDASFKRGTVGFIGGNGTWEDMAIVAMLDSNGNPVRNMTGGQLFWHLQDRFKNIYTDEKRACAFIAVVMEAWYKKRISKEGLLDKNTYSDSDADKYLNSFA